MRKPLTPWSESWIVAIEREKERLEDRTASDLIAEYGETEAMLIDEVVTDVTFDRHFGPWLDDEHEQECWEPLFAEYAARELWWLHHQCDSNTRALIDVWVADRAEKNVGREARIRAQEETNYRVLLHEMFEAA